MRARLERVAPEDLSAEIRSGAVVIDVRPADQRARDGALPGAVVVERNVLEWRLDPASPDRIAEVTGYDERIIVACNEGYSSSRAAAILQDLGLHRATDLIGGYQAWRTGVVEVRSNPVGEASAGDIGVRRRVVSASTRQRRGCVD